MPATKLDSEMKLRPKKGLAKDWNAIADKQCASRFAMIPNAQHAHIFIITTGMIDLTATTFHQTAIPFYISKSIQVPDPELSMGEAIKIGITGLPNAGKTYALLKVIEMLEANELKVGGMITEPIVEDDRRVGFYVMDWATQEKQIFAHENLESKFMVGKYGINLTALEDIGVKALRTASSEAEVIVIDEVGKMEIECDSFVDAVKEALEVDKPLILTLHKKSRNPLLQDIRRRDDVRILEVTPVNRDLLPYKIVKIMQGEIW